MFLRQLSSFLFAFYSSILAYVECYNDTYVSFCLEDIDMKVVLAGAYGNLGADVFRALIKEGHEVVALDMIERDIGVSGNYTFTKVKSFRKQK